MHFMPDTEESDAAAEQFWPDGFKEVIRNELTQALAAAVRSGNSFALIYEKRFHDKFPQYEDFARRIAEMVGIGAERGADDAFDEMNAVFLASSAAPPPPARKYCHYLWPGPFPGDVRKRIHQTIIDEYGLEQAYKNAYEDQLPGRYRNFDEFMNEIGEIVVVGAENGADDMLQEIYKSFLFSSLLPPARRHPKRLKGY